MRHCILVILIIFLEPLGFSQNYIDILKLNASTTPNNTFDSSSATTKINQLDADLTVPIKVNSLLSIISGVIYENFQTKLFSDGNTKHFGSTTLKIGVNRILNDKWSGTLVLLPKIASDYKTIGKNDFQFGGIALMKYTKRVNLIYKFGLYTNAELFGPFFVPLFGLYYLSPNEKTEINIMAPLLADINYKLAKFLNIGFNFNGQIRSYHLNNVLPNYTSTYVARSTNEFYGYLRFNLGKSFCLLTKVGQSVGRTYKVYNENDKVSFGLPALFFGDKRNQLNTDFSNGMIFQATLLYRFNLLKN